MDLGDDVVDEVAQIIYEDFTPGEAEQAMFDMIVDLKQRGARMTAKDACVISFWVTQISGKRGGPLGELSMKPVGVQSGKYSQRFDRVVSGGTPSSHDWFRVSVPLFRRGDASRKLVDIPTLPPHEVVAEEMGANGAQILEQLGTTIASGSMPRAYFDHPVVQQAQADGALARPLALYLDAVDFAREDASLGIWLSDCLTGRRWCVACFRKSEMCKCGCSGACSTHPVFRMITWSLRHLATGYYPQSLPGGEEFASESRKALRGTPLGVRGAVIAVKGDWMEWQERLGFRSWSHGLHPCPLCDTTTDSMFLRRGLSPITFPHRLRTWADYQAACAEREVVLDLNEADWRLLRAALLFVPGRGRILEAPIRIGGVDLMKGDALVPSEHVLDIGPTFDGRNPGRVTVWRRRGYRNCAVKARCALFADDVGVTPDRVMSPDWLHSFSLGVLQLWNGFLLWALLRPNAWDVIAGNDKALLDLSLPKLKAELFSWYRTERREGRCWSMLQEIKPGMCGSFEDPLLKLYGAEGNGFMHFGKRLLDVHGHKLGPLCPRFLEVQAALASIHKLFRAHPLRFPESANAELSDYVHTVLSGFEDLGVADKPKCHMLMHMVVDSYGKASPGLWGCWEDESLNQVLKRASCAGYRSTWCDRVMTTMYDCLCEREAKRLRRQ